LASEVSKKHHGRTTLLDYVIAVFTSVIYASFPVYAQLFVMSRCPLPYLLNLDTLLHLRPSLFWECAPDSIIGMIGGVTVYASLLVYTHLVAVSLCPLSWVDTPGCEKMVVRDIHRMEFELFQSVNSFLTGRPDLQGRRGGVQHDPPGHHRQVRPGRRDRQGEQRRGHGGRPDPEGSHQAGGHLDGDPRPNWRASIDDNSGALLTNVKFYFHDAWFLLRAILYEVCATIFAEKNIKISNDRLGPTRSEVLLIPFIVTHAVGNLQVFKGPDDFTGYGYFYVHLYWTGFCLPANIGEEYILLSVLLQVFVGLKRTWDTKLALVGGQGTSVPNLAISGLMLLTCVTITIHLLQFRFGDTYQFGLDYVQPPLYLVNFWGISFLNLYHPENIQPDSHAPGTRLSAAILANDAGHLLLSSGLEAPSTIRRKSSQTCAVQEPRSLLPSTLRTGV
jgi:hypothetical protein